MKRFELLPGGGAREVPGGEEVMTAETMPAPMRRGLLQKLEEERLRRVAAGDREAAEPGEVIEGQFKRLPKPTT